MAILSLVFCRYFSSWCMYLMNLIKKWECIKV
jgi:hypothetical protein